MSGTPNPPGESAPVIKQSLIPNTPAAGWAAGGIGAALLGALGWLGTHLLELERTVTVSTERITASAEGYNRRIGIMENEINTLRERIAVVERALIQERSPTRP